MIVACCMVQDRRVFPLMWPLRQSQTFTSQVTYLSPSTPQLTQPKQEVKLFWTVMKFSPSFLPEKHQFIYHATFRSYILCDTEGVVKQPAH
jgi:hypothetical protein